MALQFVGRGRPFGGSRRTAALSYLAGVFAAAIGISSTLPAAPPSDAHAAIHCRNGETLYENDCIKLPKLVHSERAHYPPHDWREQFEVTVTLQYLITETGDVKDVTVQSCTKPGMGFENAAIDCIKKRRYRPATKDGKPIAIYASIRVEFSHKAS